MPPGRAAGGLPRLLGWLHIGERTRSVAVHERGAQSDSAVARFKAVVTKFRRLDDLRRQRANLAVKCGWCGHAGIVSGETIWRWFALHRWDGDLEKVGEHMRCSVCKRRPTTLAASFLSPTIAFGPKSEDEWQRAVRRVRQ